MSERHLLRTVSAPLRRGAGRVQFGTSAGHAVVLEGLTAEEVAALEQLDGTRDVPPALRVPAARGLLALLHLHGLVVAEADEPVLDPHVRALLAPDARAGAVLDGTHGYAALSRRRAATVLVCGAGAVATALTALLRRAGVGRVALGRVAGDDWDHRAADREGRASGPTGAACGEGPEADPALVVVLGTGAVDAAHAEPWRRRQVPVLPLLLDDVEAVVGPLVVPGGPCLHCLDLTRSDLDPAWPALLGQLTKPAVGPDAEVGGETTLAALAAAMGAMVALSVVDGRAVPTGRSLEVALPWPEVRQREWPAHPRCDCGAAATVGASGALRRAR